MAMLSHYSLTCGPQHQTQSEAGPILSQGDSEVDENVTDSDSDETTVLSSEGNMTGSKLSEALVKPIRHSRTHS